MSQVQADGRVPASVVLGDRLGKMTSLSKAGFTSFPKRAVRFAAVSATGALRELRVSAPGATPAVRAVTLMGAGWDRFDGVAVGECVNGQAYVGRDRAADRLLTYRTFADRPGVLASIGWTGVLTARSYGTTLGWHSLTSVG